jgi:hypothetical protein
MSAAIDILRPDSPKRVLIVASNPAVSEQTGWPIGFWWAELTHPYWEFTEQGYRVDVASPDGGKLEGDAFSDPRDASGYSAGHSGVVALCARIVTPRACLASLLRMHRRDSTANHGQAPAALLLVQPPPMVTPKVKAAPSTAMQPAIRARS